MSLNKKRLYLQLGIEQAEAGIDVDVPMEVDTDASVDLDTSLEANDLKAETDELNDFAAATDGVEDLSVAVEAAIASGRGLTRIEAVALSKALKATAGKYIDIEDNVVPANESYDVAVHDGRSGENTENNKEQTKAAGKGIKETIKAFIQAIIKKLKGIYQKFRDLGKSITDRVGSGQNKLKLAYEQLEKSEHFDSHEIEFNLLNLHIGGKFDADKLADSLEQLETINKTILGSGYSDDEKKFLDAGFDAVKATDSNAWGKFRDGLNGFTLTTFASFGKNGTQDDGEYYSPEFPGGRHFILDPGQNEGSHQLSTIRFQRKSRGEDAERGKVKIMCPSKNELIDLLDLAFVAYSTFRTNYQKGASRLENNYKETMKRLQNFEVRSEALLAGDKGKISSIAGYETANQWLIRWLWDYNLLMAANISELAHASSAAGKAKAEEKKKEDSKTK